MAFSSCRRRAAALSSREIEKARNNNGENVEIAACAAGEELVALKPEKHRKKESPSKLGA